ncbi:hypothetical protein MMC07_002068 [Pseudocyphellaria aurata]|nr:hypothetical protein [Pseudocyphellaria aurata]
MCNQAYIPCTNLKCRGVAENLALIPCENKPNCETTYTPVPGPRQERKSNRVLLYCPACSAMTKHERNMQMRRAARRARDAGTPHGRGGYRRHACEDAAERNKQLLHTRRALTRGEEGANLQGAQANVVQDPTHNGGFGIFQAQLEPSVMGERSGDFGSAQDSTHGGVFGVFQAQSESSAMGERRGDFGSAFRSDFNGSFSHAGQSGEPVSGSNTPGPQHSHVNLADIFPPRPTLGGPPAPSLPARPENQDAQELLEMADWADGVLEDLDHLE